MVPLSLVSRPAAWTTIPSASSRVMPLRHILLLILSCIRRLHGAAHRGQGVVIPVIDLKGQLYRADVGDTAQAQVAAALDGAHSDGAGGHVIEIQPAVHFPAVDDQAVDGEIEVLPGAVADGQLQLRVLRGAGDAYQLNNDIPAVKQLLILQGGSGGQAVFGLAPVQGIQGLLAALSFLVRHTAGQGKHQA